jgi:IMP dehydrogenase
MVTVKYAVEATAHLRERSWVDDAHIMAGNVATWEGFARLADAGADSIRVGIGGGSACTTRVVSAHGVPTLVLHHGHSSKG